MTRKVFILNRGGHNFDGALKFGELVYVTEGYVNKSKAHKIYQDIAESFKDITKDDCIVMAHLGIINTLAGGVMAMKTGGRLNILMYIEGRNGAGGKYVLKELDLTALLNDTFEDVDKGDLDV